MDRLAGFVTGGKMLRGSLVQLAASDNAGKAHPEAIKAACAMELLQAFLLIHDDIMDRDDTRRGNRALYAQYQELAASRGIPDPRHFGISMGICTGDIATFLSTELIAETEVDAATQRRLLALLSREVAHVGLAQMSDLANGVTQELTDAHAIEQVYCYKTGRYTFSLPLMLGALVRGAEEEELEALSSFGEFAGIAFQLKDDELGLMAEAETLGKPVGSDILENKKTLHRLYLFSAVPEEDARRLTSLFGAESVSRSDLSYIRALLSEHRVPERVREHMESHIAEARSRLEHADGLSEYARSALMELLDYNLTRQK